MKFTSGTLNTLRDKSIHLPYAASALLLLGIGILSSLSDRSQIDAWLRYFSVPERVYLFSMFHIYPLLVFNVLCSWLFRASRESPASTDLKPLLVLNALILPALFGWVGLRFLQFQGDLVIFGTRYAGWFVIFTAYYAAWFVVAGGLAGWLPATRMFAGSSIGKNSGKQFGLFALVMSPMLLQIWMFLQSGDRFRFL